MRKTKSAEIMLCFFPGNQKQENREILLIREYNVETTPGKNRASLGAPLGGFWLALEIVKIKKGSPVGAF